MTSDRTQDRKVWFSGSARLVELRRHDDERGSLLPIEFDQLPFVPQRLFTVSGMPAGTMRGGHAHRDGQQLLLCLQGRVEIHLRLRADEAHVTLLPKGSGLLIGPMIWCQQTYVCDGTVLLVMSSEPYDPNSYIEHWNGA